MFYRIVGYAFLIVTALSALLAADHFYFAGFRDRQDGGAVNEAFLRKGSLGNLLRQGNYLSVSDDTVEYAIHDMCASDEEVRRFNPHNSFRMRMRIDSIRKGDLEVVLVVKQDGTEREGQRYAKRFFVYPGQHYYAFTFEADIEDRLELQFVVESGAELILRDLIVDGRFGRNLTLVKDGLPQSGTFSKEIAVTSIQSNSAASGVPLNATVTPLSFAFDQSAASALYQGVFPGKRNEGYCRFVANLQPLDREPIIDGMPPIVQITATAEDLTGPSGILTNKENKGKASEVPADIIIHNGKDSKKQKIGLRFHGGGIGRTKYTESYRVYARQRYGKADIDPRLIFDQYRSKPLRTIVLKYTYQAYYEKRQDFNPFNHSFALDIADHIGALVPSHGLVDFYLNDESKGLYLAMEHLSDKTIGNWLGHDDFTVYHYRKENPKSVENLYTLLLAQVRLAKGEAAFQAFRRIFNIDNVVNSILLSMYIADDDFCQGAEVIKNDFDSPGAIITTINWDLDHGFLTYDDGRFSVDPSRSTMYILQEPKGITTCHKRYVYAWLYSQSDRFRKRLRERLEDLIKKELSPEYLSRLLEPYRRINEHYFAGEFAGAIRDLESFTKDRATLLLDQLSEFERKTEESIE